MPPELHLTQGISPNIRFFFAVFQHFSLPFRYGTRTPGVFICHSHPVVFVWFGCICDPPWVTAVCCAAICGRSMIEVAWLYCTVLQPAQQCVGCCIAYAASLALL